MKAQANIQTPLPAHDINPAKIIPANAVRVLCGGVSDMTLWRWLNDPAIDFPRPICIGKRRYWREAELCEWLEAREVA